ncbi:MAG: VWA domain-containing protein, partial [Anaerolineae bacterium]
MERSWRAALVLFIVGVSMCIQPASGAQGSQLIVQLAGIQDDTFPQVTVYARVVDPQGIPVPALDEGSFRIAERGRGAIVPDTAAGETTRPLALVLALDLSISAQDWQAVQAAVEALLATCGDRDEVAVVTFADQAETAAAYGSPKEAIQAVHDLETSGDYTDLNAAVLLATRVASESLLARSAVLVLTDSWDNRGSQALADTLALIEERRVPVHVIGLGAKMSQAESQQLLSIAQATGGLAYRLVDTSRLGEELDGLNVILRHEYRIAYHSAHGADDQQQAFPLVVTSAGAHGEAEGMFTAVTHEL